MSKYYCTVMIDASVNMEVEADTPEDAAEKAECSDQGQPRLCHQCSSEVEMGDSYGVRVCTHDGMTELLDTTYTAEEAAKLKARIAELEAQAKASEWQPISTAPKDGAYLLLWEQYSRADYLPVIDVSSQQYVHKNMNTATHWMPLPAPPKSTCEPKEKSE